MGRGRRRRRRGARVVRLERLQRKGLGVGIAPNGVRSNPGPGANRLTAGPIAGVIRDGQATSCRRGIGLRLGQNYTATLSLIPSFGAWTRSSFVPRYRSVVWTLAWPAATGSAQVRHRRRGTNHSRAAAIVGFDARRQPWHTAGAFARPAVHTGKSGRCGRASNLPLRGVRLSQACAWQIPFWQSARPRALPVPPRF